MANLPPVEPQYNIAPTDWAPVVVEAPDRELRRMRWGLVPSWAADESIGSRMINARSETAHEKPAFRQALRRRRCLAPADGFYEWRQEGPGKQPYLFTLESGAPFAIAGLWETWGEGLQTYTLLTTGPNAFIGEWHDRMPVILSPEDFDLWLDPEVTDVAAIAGLLAPYEREPMRAHAVDRRMSNPRFDAPEATQPIGPTTLF